MKLIKMAVTHADLEPSRRGSEIGSSKRGHVAVALMVFCILLGLLCFVLCLIAEATRSQIVREGDGGCRYSGNGKTPLICGGVAFLSLAMAMAVQHTHLLLAVAKSDPDLSQLVMTTHHLNTLSWQAAFFFITTWVCFSVGEVLLLIGLSVESGHLKGWLTPRHSCFIAREGLFSSAGVFGITTVFLASGLSITALRAQWLLQDQQQQNQASISPNDHHPITIIAHETPVIRHQHHLYHEPGLMEYLRAFDKII